MLQFLSEYTDLGYCRPRKIPFDGTNVLPQCKGGNMPVWWNSAVNSCLESWLHALLFLLWLLIVCENLIFLQYKYQWNCVSLFILFQAVLVFDLSQVVLHDEHFGSAACTHHTIPQYSVHPTFWCISMWFLFFCSQEDSFEKAKEWLEDLRKHVEPDIVLVSGFYLIFIL